MNDVFDDYRDLTNPQNFINRTPAEQKRAALYFLQVGAIESLHSRVAYMRAINPDYVLDLDAADVPKASLWQVNLSGARMRHANFDWSNMEKSNLSRADLTGASLVGVVLRGADLRGANLTGVDLRGADLADARLDGAILDGVLEGPIPAEKLRENRAYREPAHLAVKRKNADGSTTRPMNLAGDLSSHGSLEQRDYGTPVQKQEAQGKGEDSKALEKELSEKRLEKKKEHQKWLNQKRNKDKFVAKKNYNQKQFEERKRQEEQAFLKKKQEQEDFLARKRREEESRRR